MSRVGWDAFDPDPHQATLEKLNQLMESGHKGEARTLIREYSKDHPTKAEAMRLSLVRRYGTGL